MAAPLALVGLLARSAATWPSRVAAAIAVVVATVGVGLQFHAATLFAALVAIAAGTGADSISRSAQRRCAS
jgi:hypothetical protein